MTASEKILQKAVVTSGLDSSQWNQIQAGLRDRAFFSSQVESARFLHTARKLISERANGVKSESEIRRDLRELLAEEGYQPKTGEDIGTVKDLTTKRRLDLIIRTNVDQARGFVMHLQSNAPGAYAAAPAQELIRVQDRKEKRDWAKRWTDVGGKLINGRMIALKDDPIWSKISRFGNPFPPFDFGSGMGLRSIRKSEAIKLGLITADEVKSKVAELREQKAQKQSPFNGNLEATIPELRQDSLCGKILKRNFGDQISIDNSVVKWQGNLIQDVLEGRREKARLE